MIGTNTPYSLHTLFIGSFDRLVNLVLKFLPKRKTHKFKNKNPAQHPPPPFLEETYMYICNRIKKKHF